MFFASTFLLTTVANADNTANFDGSSYVSVPHHADFNTNSYGGGYNNKNQAIAMTIWLKTTATSGTIFNRADGTGTTSGYFAKLNSNGTVEVMFRGWAGANVTTTSAVNDGEWHHFAIVGKGRNISLYVDGEIEVGPVDTDIDDGFNITKPIVFGAEQDGSNKFVGSLNDFRLYQAEVVSTPSEITTNDVIAIMGDATGAYAITNQIMMLRLGFDGNLNNSGTYGTVLNATATGSITYSDNFVYSGESVAPDYYITSPNTAVSGNLSLNDSVSSGVTYVIDNSPSNGTLTSFNAATGEFTYTPNSGFSGYELFTYYVSKDGADSPATSVKISVQQKVVSINVVNDEANGFPSTIDNIAGVVPAGFWTTAKNGFDYDTGDDAHLTALNDNTGTATSVKMKWDTVNNGGQNLGSSGFNTDVTNQSDKMMQSMGWAQSGTNILTLSGLDSFRDGNSYDVYIYTSKWQRGWHDWTDGTTTFELENGQSNGPFIEQNPSPSRIYPKLNYFAFRNKTGDTFSLQQGGWSSNYPNICGIQIVRNEPTVADRPANLSLPLVFTDQSSLTWDAVADATGYDVVVSENLDLSNPVINDTSVPSSTTSYQLTGIEMGKTYYMAVRTKTSYGTSEYTILSTNSDYWSTTTDAVNGDVDYLYKAWNHSDRFRIVKVLTETGENNENIDHTETDFSKFLIDHSDLSVKMYQGVSYDMTVTIRDNANATGYVNGKVWIDWNRDGDWDDEGENLGRFYDTPDTETDSQGTLQKDYTVTVTPPVDAVVGNARMRIRVCDSGASLDENLTANGSDTGAAGTGQDFTVSIASTPAPIARDDKFTMAVGDPNVVDNIKTNDSQAATATVVVLTQPKGGVLTAIDTVTGAFTYTPYPNYGGPDSFTYKLVEDEYESVIATVTIVVPGLMLHYPMTDAADATFLKDSTANEFHSTTIPSAMKLTGRSANFTANSTRVKTPNSQVYTDTVTMAAWVKADPTAGLGKWCGVLFTRNYNQPENEGQQTGGLQIGTGSDDSKAKINYHWTTTYYESGLEFNRDEWTLIALVIEPTKATFYAGGVGAVDLSSQVRDYNHSKLTLNVLSVGQDINSSARSFRGEMSDVRLWNKALSASDLELYFDAEKTTKAYPQLYVDSTTVTGAELSWDNIGATSYILDVATDGEFTNKVEGFDQLPVDGTSMSVTGLEPNSNFFAKVTEIYSGVTKPYSSTVGFSTTQLYDLVETGFTKEGVQFDDAAAKITIDSPNFTELTGATGASVGFWAYIDSSNFVNQSTVFALLNDEGGRVLNSHLAHSGKVYFDVASPDGTEDYQRIAVLYDHATMSDRWGYWTYTYDSVAQTVNIYFNGEKLAISTAANGNWNAMEAVASFEIASNWIGKLDEFTVWNRSLSQGEIRSLMNAKINGDESGLVVYYPFNDENGTSVTNQRIEPTPARATYNNGVLDGNASFVTSGAQLLTIPTFEVADSDAFVSTMDTGIDLVNLQGFANGTDFINYGLTNESTAATATAAPSNRMVLERSWYFSVEDPGDDNLTDVVFDVNDITPTPNVDITDSYELGFRITNSSEVAFVSVQGGGIADAANDTITFENVDLQTGFYTLISIGDVTPVVGMEVTQEGKTLTWSVESEDGVKEYRIVDLKTGELIAIVTAGEGSYVYELPSDALVKIIVVDESGFKQEFIPENGNRVNAVYDLTAGWNLIALPGNNPDLSELNRRISGDIWRWNGEAYEVVEKPVVGEGLWVYSEIADKIVISADKNSSPNVEFELGWNLVGYPVNTPVPDEASAVYSWSDHYQAIADLDGVLIQGVGYWIFVF